MTDTKTVIAHVAKMMNFVAGEIFNFTKEVESH